MGRGWGGGGSGDGMGEVSESERTSEFFPFCRAVDRGCNGNGEEPVSRVNNKTAEITWSAERNVRDELDLMREARTRGKQGNRVTG